MSVQGHFNSVVALSYRATVKLIATFHRETYSLFRYLCN